MARSSRDSCAGFTLIEVMLALALFALLGVVLYGAISLGQNAAQKTEVSFERNQRLRSVMDLLASYIRSSYPFRPLLQDASIYYQGEEQELSFVSAQSVAMGGRGIAKIHVAMEPENGVLKLEESLPVSGDEGAGAYRNTFTLREGISDFRLSYLDPQAEPEQWTEKWDGKEKRALPRAVRMSFRAENGREVEWTFPVMMAVLAP